MVFPELILDGWRAGLLRLVFPTWAQLWTLNQFDCVTDLLTHLRKADMKPYKGIPEYDPLYEEFFTYVPPKRF